MFRSATFTDGVHLPTWMERLHLLVHDAARALRLLESPRPVQIVLAGKAHPQDLEAKSLAPQLFPIREQTPVARRVEDYDLAIAAQLRLREEASPSVGRPTDSRPRRR